MKWQPPVFDLNYQGFFFFIVKLINHFIMFLDGNSEHVAHKRERKNLFGTALDQIKCLNQIK